MAPRHCTTPSAKVATTATLLLEARTAIALAIWGIGKIYINIKTKRIFLLNTRAPHQSTVNFQGPLLNHLLCFLIIELRDDGRAQGCCPLWSRLQNLKAILQLVPLRNPKEPNLGLRACAIESDAFAPPQSHRCTRWIHPLASDAETLETCTRHSDLGRPENWKKS